MVQFEIRLILLAQVESYIKTWTEVVRADLKKVLKLVAITQGHNLVAAYNVLLYVVGCEEVTAELEVVQIKDLLDAQGF